MEEFSDKINLKMHLLIEHLPRTFSGRLAKVCFDAFFHMYTYGRFKNIRGWRYKSLAVIEVLVLMPLVFASLLEMLIRELMILGSMLLKARRRRSQGVRIGTAPGTRLLQIVDFLYRSTTVELTFKPLVAEWQWEYFEALNQDRRNKARWINFQYRFIFALAMIKAAGVRALFSLFKQVVK